MKLLRSEESTWSKFTDPGETCIQKLADYEGKKFVSIQKDDVEFDETADEKKKSSKLNIG